MAQTVSTCLTRRSLAAGLALAATPAAVLTAADNAYGQAKRTMPEKSLYERLAGVFTIAAVVDHFSDAVVKNPIPRSPAQRRLALRRPIGAFGSPLRNSMRSQRNLDGPWTSLRSRSVKGVKFWQPSPLTRTRSPPATSRPLSAAEVSGLTISPAPQDRLEKSSRGLSRHLRAWTPPPDNCGPGWNSIAPFLTMRSSTERDRRANSAGRRVITCEEKREPECSHFIEVRILLSYHQSIGVTSPVRKGYARPP
jgi:hypothetical protein